MSINFFKKYSLVFFLLFLVIILIVIKIFSSNNSKTESVVTPTITPIATATPIMPVFDQAYIDDQNKMEEETVELKKKYPLAEKLPYVQEDFKINSYSSAMTLLVKIKDESVKGVTETKINEWLRENGFETGSHQIEWRVVENF